jgi:murein L,D-transpeptidase YcbB/YkuD
MIPKRTSGKTWWEHKREGSPGADPSYPRYQRTLLVLQKYTQIEKEEVADPLPQVKKPVAARQQYEATGKLVRRLQFLGDLPPSLSVPENSLDYSGAVAEGVKHFQLRHGLDSSGKLEAQTITELNRPMSDLVEQLRLMLERFRWMPHSFAQPPIIVNIPEFVWRAHDSSLHPASPDHACGRRTRSAHTDASTRRGNEIPGLLALLECAPEHFARRDRSENYKGSRVSAEKQL